jgi:hypothetical protein
VAVARQSTPPAKNAAEGATSPEVHARNSIRPSKRREAAPVIRGEPAVATSTPPNGVKAREKRAPAAVPEAVKQRFVQVGRKYYFADGAHAFTDRGKRLTTPSENTEVIRSLVQIAQARGWTDITVSGTERFRKEAWFAAQSAGLDVRGYKSTPIDQERLVRAMARREGRDAPASDTSTPEKPRGQVSDARAEGPRPITGRLVDYGRATYKHDPHEPMSFFVKIETGKGERVFWGVDLERALKQSLTKVQLGDAVGLQSRGQDAVVVKAHERDSDGNVVGEKSLDTHRNRWVVEKTEFFAARAAAAEALRDPKVRPKDAVKRHPELTGTYLQLRAAEEFARQKIRDPADQKLFVAGVRQALSQSIAQGEPLAPVRVKETPAPTRAPERARAPKPRTRDLVRE